MQPNQKFTTEQFLELYNKSLNDHQIAKTLNVSIQAIRRKRYRLELMPKNPRTNTNPTLSHQKLKDQMKRQNQKPERKAAKKKYLQRPEVKTRKKKTRKQTPKIKTCKKPTNKQPKVKSQKEKAIKNNTKKD